MTLARSQAFGEDFQYRHSGMDYDGAAAELVAVSGGRGGNTDGTVSETAYAA